MKMKIYMVVILAISLLLVTPSLASAQYNDSVSDSTGDVLYYKVTDTGFSWDENVEKPDVDITGASVEESNGIVTVSIDVKGSIKSDAKVGYQITLEDKNDEEYSVYTGYYYGTQGCYLDYPNGGKTLEESDYSGFGTSTFAASFSLDEVDNPASLTIDSVETQNWADTDAEGEYYMDEASHGSSTNGDGSSGSIDENLLENIWAGSMLCIALGVIIPIIILVVIIVLIFKLLKSDEDKGQHPSQQYQQQPQQYQQPPPEQQQEQTPPPPDESGESSSTPPPPEDEGDSKDIPPPPPEDE